MRVEVTYGHTKSDRAGDYCPAVDGWRPGAEQVLLGFTMDAPATATPTDVAEAIFEATNNPAPPEHWSELGQLVHAELQKYRATGQLPWSMCVGDTVVVAGLTDRPVLVECAPLGWTERPLTDLHTPAAQRAFAESARVDAEAAAFDAAIDKAGR